MIKTCISFAFFFLCGTELLAAGPNVVLLLADDLGYRDLTCFDGLNPTPNLLEAEPARAEAMAAHVRQWLAEPRHSWHDDAADN